MIHSARFTSRIPQALGLSVIGFVLCACLPDPALANCGNATPVSNTSVTCSGADTTGVLAPFDSANISVLIQPGASIDIPDGYTGGATLGGHGAVGSLISAGIVAPGHSSGALTVNGDYRSTKDAVDQTALIQDSRLLRDAVL